MLDNLRLIATQEDKPWLAVGDFNDIADASERRGRVVALEDGRIRKFNDNVNNCGLMDLSTLGPKMTWTNGREGYAHKLKRLDRAFGNGEFRMKFPDAAVTNLPQTTSDHSPILINLTGIISNFTNNARPFRIESMWFSYPDFMDLVNFNWAKCNHEYLSAVDMLAKSAMNWNRNIFGNLFCRKRRTLARLAGIQKAQANLFTSNLEFLERELRKEYLNILNQEEMMWQQKSRNDWIVEGDRNTRFFHISTLARRKRNKINMLKDGDGKWIIGCKDLQDHIIDFFKNLFCGTEDVENFKSWDATHPKLSQAVVKNLVTL